VFLGLGSNQGNKLQNLKTAINELSQNSQIQIQKVSAIHESKALGLDEEKPENFFNLVCRLSTTLSPQELLEVCQNIENKLGRVRQHNLTTSRPIDLDILFYADFILKTDKLCIPHPEALKRAFVFIPLGEVLEENWKDPVSGLNYAEIHQLFFKLL